MWASCFRPLSPGPWSMSPRLWRQDQRESQLHGRQAGPGIRSPTGDLRTIVTSRQVRRKSQAGICRTDRRCLWLEDIATTIGRSTETIAALLALLAPCPRHRTGLRADTPLTMDDLATIFSAAAAPANQKASCSRISASMRMCRARRKCFHLDAKERVLGILPFFHSFGYLVFWYRHVQQRGDRLSSVAARCDGDRRALRQISPHFFGLHADLSAALPTSVHAGTIQHLAGGPHRERRNCPLGSANPSKTGSASARSRAMA